MAQSGFSPILIYGSTTTGNTPSASNLTTTSLGVELAINATDGKLFYKDNAGNVQTLATKATGTIGGSNTQVQYNSSGLLAGSANMVFDGSTLTTLNSAYTGTLTGGTGVVNLGSGQFYKDASGNVGIGTSSPSALGLQVTKGSGVSAGILFSNAANNWQINTGTTTNYLAFVDNQFAERMRIDSSGNVGIGITAPTARLHLSTASGSTALTMSTNSNQNNNFTIVNDATYGIFASNYGSTGVKVKYALQMPDNSMIIDSSGYVYFVGSGTSPSYSPASGVQILNLVGNTVGVISIGHANGTASGNNYVTFGYNSSGIGSISQNGTTGVLYNLTSDYRLKDNATPLTGASEFIMALKPKSWDWWDGSGKGVGFIAHEFMEVAKYSGNGTKDELDDEGKPKYQSIQPSSSEVMANLVALVQEQQALITTMQAKLKDAGILGF